MFFSGIRLVRVGCGCLLLVVGFRLGSHFIFCVVLVMVRIVVLLVRRGVIGVPVAQPKRLDVR